VLASWGEGASDAGEPGGAGTLPEMDDATWLHLFYSGTSWTTPGGVFDSTPSRIAGIDGTGDYVWDSSPEMIADVQSWLDDPANNFGWILRHAEEATRGSARRISSRERLSKSQRPVLEITYTPGPTATERTSWGSLKTREFTEE